MLSKAAAHCSRLAAAIWICGLLAFAMNVSAFELEVVATAASEYTTNTALTENNEVDEWIYTPGINLGANHDSAVYELEANYRLERRIHQEDLFDDENVTTGKGALTVNAIPGRLQFDAQYIRTETPIRSIVAARQSNLQENALTRLGPTLKFKARGKDEVDIQYSYGKRTSNDTDTDSSTHAGTLSYRWNLSDRSRLEFETLRRETDFDDSTAPDLTTTIGQVRWLHTTSRVEVSLAGGYNSTDRSMGRDTVDGGIFDLEGNWQLSSNTSMEFSAAHDIRDQSTALSSGGVDTGQTAVADSDLNEVFENNRAEIGLAHQFGSNRLKVSAFYDEDNYEDVERDVARIGARLAVSRQMNTLTSFTARLEVTNDDFKDQDVENDRVRGGVALTRRLNRQLSLTTGVSYDEQDSELNFNSYDEWRFSIRLSYVAL